MSTIDYSNIKSSDLLAIYNEAARALGERTVNKFADKPTAVKRTQAIIVRATEIAGFVQWMRDHGHEAAEQARKSTPPPAMAALVKAEPVAAEKKTAPKVDKKERRMSFAFKPMKVQKAPKGEGSLRTLCLARLKEGARFDTVIRLVEKFDSNRGKGNQETIERRAYELVRIMHYQLGYGVSHDETTGMIRVYS
jgi:hypothetical protein